MTPEQLQRIRDVLAFYSNNADTDALAILDAALAAEPQPAVWMQSDHLHKAIGHACGADSFLARCSHRQLMPDYQPLFTAPVAAQREWVGLGGDKSIEEMIVAGGFWDCLVDDLEPLEGYQSMSAEQDAKNTLVRLVRSIDAALKEKNA